MVEWNKIWSPLFPCCPVSLQCLWRKTLAEKKSPLIRRFLNSDLTAYFLDDETIYHTHITLFSLTISTATVIKTTNVACVISFVIDLATKYSIISTETCKITFWLVPYLAVLIGTMDVFTWPTFSQNIAATTESLYI